MSNVKLQLIDELTGQSIERVIDISNIMIADGDLQAIAPVDQQRELLEAWITERGNDQHGTILRLESWEIEGQAEWTKYEDIRR